MPEYSNIKKTVRTLDEKQIEYALVHQAALAAYTLDTNCFVYGVDIIVPDRKSFRKVKRISSENLVIRPWLEVGGYAFDQIPMQRSRKYGCKIVTPHFLLDTIEEAPNINLFREGVAFLAATLYEEQLTDGDLAEFRKYVRRV